MQAERLAAIGQMVTVLVHESRNALQRSKAYLEELVDQLRDLPEALTLLDGARRAQRDIERLFQDVRTYAAPLTLHPEPCNLTRICHQAWVNLEAARQGRHATFRVDANGCDTNCMVDYSRMEQVLRNLLENSLAACTDPIEIEVSIMAIEPATPTRSVSEGDPKTGNRTSIRVAIRDNGPGFAPEMRARIFEPFVTTKKNGTGLGMAIVKQIVEAHGGQVSLGPGPGGEVFITLPCTNTEKEPTTMNSTIAPATATVESFRTSAGELIRATHRWERKIGKLLLRTLPSATLNLPLQNADDSEDIEWSTVRELAEALIASDEVIENSVTDTLREMGLDDTDERCSEHF